MVKCGADVAGANTFPKVLNVTAVKVLQRLEHLDEEEEERTTSKTCDLPAAPFKTIAA